MVRGLHRRRRKINLIFCKQLFNRVNTFEVLHYHGNSAVQFSPPGCCSSVDVAVSAGLFLHNVEATPRNKLPNQKKKEQEEQEVLITHTNSPITLTANFLLANREHKRVSLTTELGEATHFSMSVLFMLGNTGLRTRARARTEQHEQCRWIS